MLTVTLYPDSDSLVNDEGRELKVDFVSLVNNQTYGPPALVAPAPSGREHKRAEPGEEVLYINTNLMPAFKIVEDD